MKAHVRKRALFALAVVGAVAGGYGVGLGVFEDGRDGASGDAPPAKILDQAPPSDMVSMPDPNQRSDPEAAPSVRVFWRGSDAVIAERTPPHDTVARPPKPAPLPAWQRHAVASSDDDDRPRIAIIIDDLGVDRRRTARAIALPGPLTLAFLSYAGNLHAQTAAARQAGHELLVHVGMEPSDPTIDAGPSALQTDLEPETLRQRLDWHLGRFEGYVGLNNHMGSHFTAHARGVEIVLADVHERGLLFVDSRTTPHTQVVGIANRLGVPVASRNVFLDHIDSPSAVAERLTEAERIAAERGKAIAIGHPRDATLDALAAWLPDAAARGYIMAPVSAMVEIANKAPSNAKADRSFHSRPH